MMVTVFMSMHKLITGNAMLIIVSVVMTRIIIIMVTVVTTDDGTEVVDDGDVYGDGGDNYVDDGDYDDYYVDDGDGGVDKADPAGDAGHDERLGRQGCQQGVRLRHLLPARGRPRRPQVPRSIAIRPLTTLSSGTSTTTPLPSRASRGRSWNSR